MTESQTEKPRRRWLMPLLFASLAVNLLIAGIVAGFLAAGPGGRKGDDMRQAGEVIGAPFFRALPQADRRALLADAMRDRDNLRENRRQLRDRFERLLGALRAEPFDPEAVRRVLAEQRRAASERLDIGEALLIDRLSGMTPEGRAAYADRLAEGMRGFNRN